MALGTDSRASNPDLNLLSEVQFVASRFPQIDPATLLRMATLDAAEALGFGDVVGSLTPGKRAEIKLVTCDGDPRNPYSALLTPNARLTSPAT